MQGAQLRVRRQGLQQRLGVLRVEKRGFTALLYPARHGAQGRRHQLCSTGAKNLDHIRLQVLRNQGPRLPFGNFSAMVEHQQPRAQPLSLVHEMGGQQNGFTLLQQQLQALPHQVAGLGVEAGGGLVEQQQARVIDQRTRQAEPALHTARQLARLGFGLVRERGKLQQGRNTSPNLGVFHAKVAAINQQVFGAVEIWVQCVHLADHAQLRFDRQRIAGHLPAQRLDRAAIGHRQPQAHANGGGLASAVGANHAQAFAGGNVKRQVIHHGGGAIALGQMPG